MKTIPRISRWLLCIRAGVCPSTTLFQRRGAVSNIASKCTDPKTRAMRIARKRSNRTSPSKQAVVQLFQPLFCGAQERWRTVFRYYISGPSTERSVSVCSGRFYWNRYRRRFAPGTGCVRGLKDAYFHIQIAPHRMCFLRFALEGTAYQYPVLLLQLALAPCTFSKCMDAALSPPQSERDAHSHYLDEWWILAQLRNTPANHIDKLLRH